MTVGDNGGLWVGGEQYRHLAERTLSEDDVRRIVREEIGKWEKEKDKRFLEALARFAIDPGFA